MQLQVGKKYKSRSGRIVTIIAFTPNRGFPFLGETGMYTERYTATGKYYLDSPDGRDLIEEVVENPPCNNITLTVDEHIKQIEAIIGRKVQLTIL